MDSESEWVSGPVRDGKGKVVGGFFIHPSCRCFECDGELPAMISCKRCGGSGKEIDAK